jgi:hypothetical protein
MLAVLEDAEMGQKCLHRLNLAQAAAVRRVAVFDVSMPRIRARLSICDLLLLGWSYSIAMHCC